MMSISPDVTVQGLTKICHCERSEAISTYNYIEIATSSRWSSGLLAMTIDEISEIPERLPPDTHIEITLKGGNFCYKCDLTYGVVMVYNGYTMVNDDDKQYDLNLLRGWQRDQLKLLKEFSANRLVSQTRLSGASGMRQGSHELGGKLTALTRADLIVKAGRDENGQWMWQLNEDKVDRDRLQDFLKKLEIK